jgi:nucleoside-diphosphate-sugar epimerase
MRILVTGASGFIGSHLTRLLVETGQEIYILYQPGSSLYSLQDILPSLHVVQGDLLSQCDVENCVNAAQPELCFHLAWYTDSGKYLVSEKNLDYLNASIFLTKQLIRSSCKKLVAIGTCLEYNTDLGYLSEEGPTLPRSLYAASKLSLHWILEQLTTSTMMKLAWVRLFYQYGPFENERRLVPYVITGLLKNLPVELTGGKQVRDFLHIQDVASAIWVVGREYASGVVNIGSGIPVTVRTIAETIGELLGKSELLKFGVRPYLPLDPMFVCAKIDRLTTELDWTPSWTLKTGLIHTIEWFIANQSV